MVDSDGIPAGVVVFEELEELADGSDRVMAHEFHGSFAAVFANACRGQWSPLSWPDAKLGNG